MNGIKKELGNVLATVSDRRVLTENPSDSDPAHWWWDADVISAQDYYPFGMQMPDRIYQQSEKGHRYGFNGMERDDEVKGVGNSYDFGARIYDSRIARFLSVDPLARDYPELSDYAIVANNPIIYIDPTGEKIVIPNPEDFEPVLKMINSRALGLFGINQKGELYLIKETGDASKYSTYYRDRLIEAINSEASTIVIEVEETRYTKDKDGNVVEENIDVVHKGGVTASQERHRINPDTGEEINTSISKILVSGHACSDFKDTEGNVLRDEGADILAHELVGHAIPNTVSSDTGNAVENENKIRAELGEGRNQLRAADPTHIE